MVRINLAKMDGGIFGEKIMGIREYNRRVEMAKEFVLYSWMFLGMTLLFCGALLASTMF